MGKSYKKVPIIGNCGNKSEKKDKRLCNKRIRRNVKITLQNYNYDDSLFMTQDESLNKWLMAKDGKHYCDNPEFIEKIMRK